jgi:hypothetical protein
MNAAIRAQRERHAALALSERHAAPRTIAPAGEAAPFAEPEEAPPPSVESPRKSMLDRLRGR